MGDGLLPWRSIHSAINGLLTVGLYTGANLVFGGPFPMSALVNNLYLQRKFALQQATDDAIAALTLAQVNAALRRYIDPARWVVIWAGDFKN